MTPKAKLNELISVREMAAQRWAYERRLEHLSYREMAELAAAPEGFGGLGYLISEAQLKGLVMRYRDRMAEIEEASLDEHRERELADLDRQHRALVTFLDPVDRLETKRAAEALGTTEDDPRIIALRDDKVRLAALREMRAVGESRRKLLGLDAPQQVRAEVVVKDAVFDELNDMLARAGAEPIRTE